MVATLAHKADTEVANKMAAAGESLAHVAVGWWRWFSELWAMVSVFITMVVKGGLLMVSGG